MKSIIAQIAETEQRLAVLEDLVGKKQAQAQSLADTNRRLTEEAERLRARVAQLEAEAAERGHQLEEKDELLCQRDRQIDELKAQAAKEPASSEPLPTPSRHGRKRQGKKKAEEGRKVPIQLMIPFDFD